MNPDIADKTLVDMTVSVGAIDRRDVNTIRGQLQDLFDRSHPAATVRWDTATLAAVLNLMHARVPTLRHVLEQMTHEGLILAEHPTPGTDRTWLVNP